MAVRQYLWVMTHHWHRPRRAQLLLMLPITVGGLFVLIALSTLVVRMGSQPALPTAHIPYDTFLSEVSAGNVKTATIDVETQEISGAFRHPITYARETASLYSTTAYPLNDDSAFRRMLTAHGVALVALRPVPLATRLASLGLFLLGVCGLVLIWLGTRRLSA